MLILVAVGESSVASLKETSTTPTITENQVMILALLLRDEPGAPHHLYGIQQRLAKEPYSITLSEKGISNIIKKLEADGIVRRLPKLVYNPQGPPRVNYVLLDPVKAQQLLDQTANHLRKLLSILQQPKQATS